MGQDDVAVSPVIGSVLILVITILGIAGVLYWGAPMIERIQVQNAQVAMVGEFEDIRDSSRELSVPDHSRFPTIVVPRGQVSLTSGTRIMITDDQDPAKPNCDFHVTDWADTTAKTQVTVGASGCLATYSPGAGTCTPAATKACLEVYQVTGGTLSKQTVPACDPCATVTIAGIDFSTGDWMFRLTNGQTSPTVYAQAWVHSGDDLTWSTDSTTGKRTVTYDDGAIFSQTAGTIFLEKPSVIGDTPFGSSYFGLWLRTLNAAGYSSITGSGQHQVYLSLIGNYDRVETASVSKLRFDIAGPLAQSWCNGLLQRTTLTGASYKSQLVNSAGQAIASCGQITSDGVRSVCYAKVLKTADACTPALAVCASPTTSPCFTFRFLHARIYTSLAV